RNASKSKSNGILPLTSVRKKKGTAPPEPPKHHRRLEKSITGHRIRVDVISRVPRPAFTAAVISSSLLRRLGDSALPVEHLQVPGSTVVLIGGSRVCRDPVENIAACGVLRKRSQQWNALNRGSVAVGIDYVVYDVSFGYQVCCLGG